MQAFTKTPNFSISRDSGKSQMPSMHYHSTYELYFLDAGSRDYFIEDQLFRVQAGDFVLIPPRELHRTGGEYGVRTLINFSEAFLSSVYTPSAMTSLLECFKNRLVTPSAKQKSSCIHLLQKLEDTQNPTEQAIHLGLLLWELRKCQKIEIPDTLVGRVVSYIHTNYGIIESIEDIASHFYISKFHLCRIFKDAMQITVMTYLNQIRMKQARHFLEFSDKDIGEISQLCGFHTPAYFSRVFFTLVGLSPSAYRKQWKESSENHVNIV